MTLHIKDQGVYAAGGTVKKADGTFDPIHGQRAEAGQLRYCDHASVFYQSALPPRRASRPLSGRRESRIR